MSCILAGRIKNLKGSKADGKGLIPWQNDNIIKDLSGLSAGHAEVTQETRATVQYSRALDALNHQSKRKKFRQSFPAEGASSDLLLPMIYWNLKLSTPISW